MQCTPTHILYLMGAGHLLLIAVILFISIKKSRSKGKVSYIRFRSHEENNLPTDSNYNPESRKVPYDNNLKEENYKKFKYYSIIEKKVNPGREDCIERRILTKHAENAEINSHNNGPTVFIPPNIMEKICEAVLNKKSTKTAETGGDDIKNESNSSNELLMTKIKCDSSDYDIVPTAKSVQLRISTCFNDVQVSSKDNTNPARESYYKYPITLKMAYVNANEVTE